MKRKTTEEIKEYCKSELERVSKIAEEHNLFFVLVCRTHAMSGELSSHVFYAESRTDWVSIIDMQCTRFENLQRQLGISYWIETNERFIDGGILE